MRSIVLVFALLPVEWVARTIEWSEQRRRRRAMTLARAADRGSGDGR